MKLKFVNKIFVFFLLFQVKAFSNPSRPFQLKESIKQENLKWTRTAVSNSNEAKKLIKERSKLVLSQLEPSYDPYRGTNLAPELCQVKNLPKPISRETKTSFYRFISIHASENKIIGDCSNTKKLLKSQYLMLYCRKQKSLFFIKYFYPINQDWNLKPVADCL